MNAYARVLAGGLLVALGAFSTITFWSEFVTMVKAGIGPLLVLIGAFIVWLESDELRMEREQSNQDDRDREGLQRQFQTSTGDREAERAFDPEEVVSGTVNEVRETVREMDSLTRDDYKDLLEAERTTKDRKTVKEFLENRID